MTKEFDKADSGATDAPASDANVTWTAHSAGFAELRTRVHAVREEANQALRKAKAYGENNWAYHEMGRSVAFDLIVHWLDVLEADAKDASTRREEPDFNGPSR